MLFNNHAKHPRKEVSLDRGGSKLNEQPLKGEIKMTKKPPKCKRCGAMIYTKELQELGICARHDTNLDVNRILQEIYERHHPKDKTKSNVPKFRKSRGA